MEWTAENANSERVDLAITTAPCALTRRTYARKQSLYGYAWQNCITHMSYHHIWKLMMMLACIMQSKAGNLQCTTINSHYECSSA